MGNDQEIKFHEFEINIFHEIKIIILQSWSWDQNYHFAKLIMRSKLLHVIQEIEKGLGAPWGLGR